MNIAGGRFPRRISLRQPPPTAVTPPTTTVPKISSSRRIATSEPATENAIVPIISAEKNSKSAKSILFLSAGEIRFVVKDNNGILLTFLETFKFKNDDFVDTLDKERCGKVS